jgi:hypothetical protein
MHAPFELGGQVLLVTTPPAFKTIWSGGVWRSLVIKK